MAILHAQLFIGIVQFDHGLAFAIRNTSTMMPHLSNKMTVAHGIKLSYA